MLEAYRLEPEAFTSTQQERADLPVSWWQSRLGGQANAPDVVFGVLDAGQLVGVAGLSFESRQKTRHKATLFGMYVKPGYRKHGIATRLVDEVLQYAKTQRGTTLVKLTVTEGSDKALELYRKSGFREFGVEPDAIALDDRYLDKVHMYKRISQGTSEQVVDGQFER